VELEPDVVARIVIALAYVTVLAAIVIVTAMRHRIP
jgi:hypothetical protein